MPGIDLSMCIHLHTNTYLCNFFCVDERWICPKINNKKAKSWGWILGILFLLLIILTNKLHCLPINKCKYIYRWCIYFGIKRPSSSWVWRTFYSESIFSNVKYKCYYKDQSEIIYIIAINTHSIYTKHKYVWFSALENKLNTTRKLMKYDHILSCHLWIN